MSSEPLAFADSQIPYRDILFKSQMSIVSNALKYVEQNGLDPDIHALYIAFNTKHPNVKIPSWLKLKYPTEMVIVIQHSFQDLSVGEDDFAITLFFNGIQANLTIPFEAIDSFSDEYQKIGFIFDHLKAPVAPSDKEIETVPDKATEKETPLESSYIVSSDQAESNNNNNVVRVDFGKKNS